MNIKIKNYEHVYISNMYFVRHPVTGKRERHACICSTPDFDSQYLGLHYRHGLRPSWGRFFRGFFYTSTGKRKIYIVRPSVRMEQLGSTVHEFLWKLIFEIFFFFFANLLNKIQVSLKSDKNNCTSYEDQYTILTISRWILLIMRNVSHKSFRENQNTHFMFNNLFSPKIVPFMR